MPTTSKRTESTITAIAPQFLVDNLERSMAYYRDILGFEIAFVYESFYASVTRNGHPIHLKCAPKTESDRAHRKQHEHLDAFIDVIGIEALYQEFRANNANITKHLDVRTWDCKDFHVEYPDGYILCFSEAMP